MSFYRGPKVVTNGLVLALDAADTNSYPGTGTSWRDMSGNGYHHTVFNGPFTIINNVPCFDVTQSTYYIDRTSTTYTFTSEHTMISWARPLADSQVTTWRTLFRTQSFDHPILIQDSTNLIGYYDNNVAGFVSFGLNAGTLGIENRWTMFTLVGSGASSTLYINGTSSSGTVAYNATGLSHYTIGSTSSGGQPFGYIATTQLYNRPLSTTEIQQNFNALRGRFGI